MRYFISGHRDLTKKEFEDHYVPQILNVLRNDPHATFVVGDWPGCDAMFLNFMVDYPDNFVLVYCVDEPRIYLDGDPIYMYFNMHCKRRKDYDECDASMTHDSDFDIAWIRKGREDSHTAQNIKRRYGSYN